MYPSTFSAHKQDDFLLFNKPLDALQALTRNNRSEQITEINPKDFVLIEPEVVEDKLKK